MLRVCEKLSPFLCDLYYSNKMLWYLLILLCQVFSIISSMRNHRIKNKILYSKFKQTRKIRLWCWKFKGDRNINSIWVSNPSPVRTKTLIWLFSPISWCSKVIKHTGLGKKRKNLNSSLLSDKQLSNFTCLGLLFVTQLADNLPRPSPRGNWWGKVTCPRLACLASFILRRAFSAFLAACR